MFSLLSNSMIDIDDLRKRPAAYQDAATKKGINLSVEEFLGLDKERRDLQQSADAMKEDERLKAFEEMKALSSDLKEKEAILKEVESKWLSIQLGLPSIPLDCVPVGKTEEDNVEVRKEGELPKFDFEPKDHVTLG